VAVETRVVDNRVFLFGLDSMYRERMKRYERCIDPQVLIAEA
jgi:hypothetical protein